MKSEETIFAEATELPAAEQAAFVREQCGDDNALQQRIENLLAAHGSMDSFLDHQDLQDTLVRDLKANVGDDIGPYRLLQKLGEGGFGVVFMAEQRHPIRRQVALKVIKPGMDSSAVIARFEAERQALAMMNHPNIARVFDGGTVASGDRPYFVMELVQGVPITEFCDTNSLSTTERLELFVSVCNAVHHAHQKGIIHRDIKPSNVMVTLHDGKPVVKVIDFGVAKALHQRLTEKTMFTQYGMMVGTPQYMSPEQAEMSGLDVDTRSDVYSLAVLLYELMTGVTPLQSETLRAAGYEELQRMIREEEPLKPSQRLSSAGEHLTVLAKHRSISPDRLPREIRGDLDWIVMKGLEKDRRRRYDSANDFAADIQRALDNEPVVAGPPSLWYRSKKFVLRNRSGVATGAAVVALLAAIGFGLAASWNQYAAEKQKDENRLNNAVDQATTAMLSAIELSPSDEHWAKADSLVSHVQGLAVDSSAGSSSRERAEGFLGRYESARRDRKFAFDLEELLIRRATNRDLESWTAMENEFRRIMRDRGYDLDQLSPSELAEEMFDDPSKVKMTDGLELWIATRMELSRLGGPEMAQEEVEQWTDAMCVVDPDPLRTAIRKIIFKTAPADEVSLESIVSSSDLSQFCPRKLSWLSESFDAVGSPNRSDEVQQFALSLHAGDLMLNFEYATALLSQGKYETAIRYFMRCTAIRPKVPGVWRSLASAYLQNGELDAARRALDIAIDLDPQHGTAHLERSKVLLQQESFAAAIASSKTALSLNGDLIDAWRLIGRANMKLKQFSQALVALETYQQKAGDSAMRVEDWLVECRREIGATIDSNATVR
ncbi:serine/threonine-protein kinase [Mariniblastus fucicola]|uniref:Serine/threonine-protein kinase PknB n=1 Tax=Mariniblastus fucicola TaxID=980251 RepID=A0A5B9PB90_9BACT|nr:serine/threonine-protein kinase [Mariniblastus fucicola]QEG20383.1 Serine/threonine-protein kinase PknB [Mariniblastus fucicola]